MSQPTLTDATKVWAKIGFLSFGGPAGQIALMHKEVVETRKWMSERHFLNALSFCMLLPGPEAMQLATFAGWRLHGTLGGLIAGLLFVLPGAFVILALAFLYITFGQLPAAEAIFLGIKATVVIIVIEALLRVSKKALHSMAHLASCSHRLRCHLFPQPAVSPDHLGRRCVWFAHVLPARGR